MARIRRVLAELGLAWVDLTEPHDRTLAAGLPVRASPGDPMHPGPFAGAAFAEHALAAGLFARGE